MKNTLRVSLNTAQPPFLYRDAPRNVTLPGLDSNIRNQGYTGGADSIDWGVPGLLFMENVMPIARGYISVQFNNIISPLGGANFDQAVTLRDKNENNALFVPANGANYILNAKTGTWNSSLAFTPTNKLFSRAYVQGRTFVCYEKERLFEFDGSTNVLVDRTSSLVLPTGFSIADIRGIGGASNYLLLFTDIQVFWSSPSDPLNFDRTTNNGSGYQIPQDARGRISAILPVSGGAIIYTVRNAVAVTFTNNAATPFIFRGISNSGGVESYEQVAYDADERYQYVYGSGGLQRVSLQIAEGVWPEVTDFITSGLYEEWDNANNQVITRQVGSYLSVKLTYVSQRFLIISYGESSQIYTAALIYDASLQRWGKIKKTHVDVFTYPYPNILGDLEYDQLNTDISGLGDQTIAQLGVGILTISPPKKSIGFLLRDGTIDLLTIDYRVRPDFGVIVLGQIQHNRDRMTTLHNVELEGVHLTGIAPRLYDLVSLNGKDVSRVDEYFYYETGDNFLKYFGSSVAVNHQLALVGAFELTGFIAQVAKHGRIS